MAQMLEAPVEVTMSARCRHGCYSISMGSRTIWRISGNPPMDLSPDTQTFIHNHHDDLTPECREDCWGFEVIE